MIMRAIRSAASIRLVLWAVQIAGDAPEAQILKKHASAMAKELIES